MDFALTDGQRALKGEVRAWLDEELGPDWVGEDVDIVDTDAERARAFNRALAARGWMVPAWPERFGGRGWSQLDRLLLTEQLVYHRAPAGGRLFGVGMVGPTLQIYGTPEQQARHLPPIREGTVQWCQGFSEPGVGSNLASLRTRAERDGDDYVINIVGRHEFNQVFFEDVRVPAANLVGAPTRGWYVATTTLDLERSSIAAMANGRRLLDDLVDYTRTATRDGRPLFDDPRVRRLLAEIHIDVEMGRLISYRVAWL